MSKQDLNWKWYDTIAILILFLASIFSLVFEEWMIALVSLILLITVIGSFWKDIYVALANFYLKRENIKKANEYCDKVLSKDSNNILALNKKGEIAIYEKNYSSALSFYEKSIKANPKYIMTWNLKGELFEILDEKEKSEDAFRRALNLKQDSESNKLHNRILPKFNGVNK